MERSYPSKLLIFGEYTVINNSEALAVPFRKFEGKWDFFKSDDTYAINSNKVISEILNYLKGNDFININFDSFNNDVKNGLWFNSNIPHGYGLGSSGALVAGIYDRYFENKINNYSILKKNLGLIESYFHGTSSGTDPLVSYLNRSIKIETDNSIKILPELNSESPKGDISIFVLDCGFARNSNNLINYYLENCKDQRFLKNYVEPAKTQTSLLIDSLINRNEIIKDSVKTISELQFKFMKKMIPENLLELWEIGLKNEIFSLKLCGAGGGGFMLGFGYDNNKYHSFFENYITYNVITI
jgi:mevalonate kinase